MTGSPSMIEYILVSGTVYCVIAWFVLSHTIGDRDVMDYVPQRLKDWFWNLEYNALPEEQYE